MGDSTAAGAVQIEPPIQPTVVPAVPAPTSHLNVGEQISQAAPTGPPVVPPASTSQHAFAAQLDMSQSSSVSRTGPYNMAPMANALPHAPPYRTAGYAHGSHQRYSTASPPMMPQMPQYMHMANQAPYIQHPSPSMPYYGGGGQMSPTQSQSPMPPRQNMAFYPNPMMMNHPQQTFYYPHAPQYPGQGQAVPPGMMPAQYIPGSPPTIDPRAMNQSPTGTTQAQFQANKQNQDAADGKQSAVRGPPRKPRQSGHAIWIGNLPPQADLMNLVGHVCERASGLESLFLISKSNCAFANFKDEPTCVAAQQKLHESTFQGGRLVSRLRKSTVEGASGSTAPTGPAASNASPSSPTDQASAASTPKIDDAGPAAGEPTQPQAATATDGVPQQDRFFILKSLTVEDLELSVRTGIWATQSHNEETLTGAFKNADNVYLVFSANKSGEYFGYARMLSEINEDPAAAIEFAPKAQTVNDSDLPKAIPTEATDHVPKGRIIDDSARGTIFWELERDDSDGDSDNESEVSSKKSASGEEEAKTWGKPFKLEWLSTFHLPFYRTRGLRNPWNSNREVKIARDGTELEPSVGRRLIGLFNRLQTSGQFSPQMRPPIGIVPGHGQVRPYGP